MYRHWAGFANSVTNTHRYMHIPFWCAFWTSQKSGSSYELGLRLRTIAVHTAVLEVRTSRAAVRTVGGAVRPTISVVRRRSDVDTHAMVRSFRAAVGVCMGC